MSENVQTGFLVTSLLLFAVFGCLNFYTIYTTANTNSELVALQAELKQVKEELGLSKTFFGEKLVAEPLNTFNLKRATRQATPDLSVSELLFQVLSSWFGKSNPRPVIRCTSDEQTETTCSVKPATSKDMEEIDSSIVLLEEAISRIIVDKIETALDCSFSSTGPDKCGFRPGPPGVNGTKGDRGEKGDRGQRGRRGQRGVAGTDGEKGGQGEKGLAGVHGVPGSPGPQGNPGVPGVNGLDGRDGRPGEDGEPGEIGPLGPKGQSGDRGERGQKGDIGPIGETGAEGATGPQGPVGPKGDRGLKGETGPIGPIGQKGTIGSQGLQGLTGPAGQKGQTGQKGAKGATGSVGQQGDQGVQGNVGPRGATGAKGQKGERGATGLGQKGERGAVGQKGRNGERGSVGQKGQMGSRGAVGQKGSTGAPGPKGQRGDTQSLCTRTCQNGGTCIPPPNTCSCPSGYTGTFCERRGNVNECTAGTHNCQQVCIDTITSFRCSCRSGYVLNSDGRTCRRILDECFQAGGRQICP